VIQGWLVRMLVLTRFHTTINNVRIIHWILLFVFHLSSLNVNYI
jgi:hypothetical protein